jgi:hypothetical protein
VGKLARASSGSLPSFPSAMPAEIRAKAREKLIDDLDTLQGIIENPEEKGQTRVQAIKLKATVGGVLSSASIPRDVVEGKIELTAEFLRQRLGDAVYATLLKSNSPSEENRFGAEGLSSIWNL